MHGDLLGAPLGGDVLGARQRRAPAVAGEADEVLGDQPHGSPRAFLPRRIRRRVDDNLTDDAPSGVVGVTTGHEKPGERLGDSRRPGLGAVAVEMPQRGAHTTAVLDRSGKLAWRPARLFSVSVDPSTVLGVDQYPPFNGAPDDSYLSYTTRADGLIFLITETYPTVGDAAAPTAPAAQPAV